MKKLLTVTVAAAALLLSFGAYAADDLPDYSDKSNTCDKDDIGDQMKEMAEQNPLGPKVIYIREAVETSRSADELRCRVTVVHSRGTQVGVFRYHNQDGHALVGFKPGARK
ncbi:hypothetical protein [Bradyrhizobium sp. USDA 4508]